MAASHIEERFLQMARDTALPDPIREVVFAKALKRRWRFDFCWPSVMVAVEIEGGGWNGGRHTRGSGFVKDCEKYNAAAFLGWTVFRATPEILDDPDFMRNLVAHIHGVELVNRERQYLDIQEKKRKAERACSEVQREMQFEPFGM
jgi:hypothetical protein